MSPSLLLLLLGLGQEFRGALVAQGVGIGRPGALIRFLDAGRRAEAGEGGRGRPPSSWAAG